MIHSFMPWVPPLMLFKLPCFFQLLQSFRQLKLTLKIFTTKTMWFYCKGTTPPPALKITTCKGAILEQVTAYEYLSIWLETSLFFPSIHISKLQSKAKAKLGFLYWNRSSFTTSYSYSNYHSTHVRLWRRCKGCLQVHSINSWHSFPFNYQVCHIMLLYIHLSTGPPFTIAAKFTGSLSFIRPFSAAHLLTWVTCCSQRLSHKTNPFHIV